MTKPLKNNTRKFKDQTFSISGLSCISCVGKIESAINIMDGVKNIRVDLASGTARIEWDPLVVNRLELINAIEVAGYKVTDMTIVDGNARMSQDGPVGIFHHPGPYIKAMIAFFAIIGFYLGILTLTSDWYFATVQFSEYRVWIILLALGLGIQVFLYSNLRLYIHRLKMNGAGKTVVVSGGLSTAGMAACCAHYVVTVLPVLGIPFVTTTIAVLEQYQTWLFLIGVLSNLAGIVYMLRLMIKNRMIGRSIA